MGLVSYTRHSVFFAVFSRARPLMIYKSGIALQNACRKENDRISTTPFLVSHFSPSDKIENCPAQFLAVCWIIHVEFKLHRLRHGFSVGNALYHAYRTLVVPTLQRLSCISRIVCPRESTAGSVTRVRAFSHTGLPTTQKRTQSVTPLRAQDTGAGRFAYSITMARFRRLSP